MDARKIVSLLLGLLSTIALGVAGWALERLVDMNARVAVLETQQEAHEEQLDFYGDVLTQHERD